MLQINAQHFDYLFRHQLFDYLLRSQIIDPLGIGYKNHNESKVRKGTPLAHISHFQGRN